MNIIEIVDYQMEETLEEEKSLRDKIKEQEAALRELNTKLTGLLTYKQALKYELEYNIRIRSNK